MIRVLHFSDVHVQEPVLSGPIGGLVGKRMLAGVNLWFVRGKLFAEARPKLTALARFAESVDVQAAFCTGDYTALGTGAEHRAARAAIEPFTRLPGGFCTVPGNHDLYLHDAVRDGRFEGSFAPFTRSDLPNVSVDGAYPFVRLMGDELAVIGVNSARPNPNPFLSSGAVPAAQLAALERVLADDRLRDKRRIVITHYGILRADGEPDAPRHGLDNAAALVAVCKRGGAVLAHGHIHHTYHHPETHARPPIFCAGTATQRGREGFWLYELDGARMTARRGGFRAGVYALLEEPPVVL